MPSAASAPLPWYRQTWPWLLMLMPAIALFGGLATFWLAATTNNALVVDDYYREGKAINLQLARDTAATTLGLAATLRRGTDGRPVLELAAAAGTTVPAALILRVVHATRAELDQTYRLSADATGRYRADSGTLPAAGRWNLMIEDPARVWRLSASATDFNQPVHFAARR